jgi:four helix bundle protein
MPIQSFRDLEVWQRSMTLVESVYALTDRFPAPERYGLTTQIRRSAVSIPSNIAEGHARKTGHYLNHLNTASGSCAELQTQLELSRRLKLAPRALVDPLLREGEIIGRMLHALVASVAESTGTPYP